MVSISPEILYTTLVIFGSVLCGVVLLVLLGYAYKAITCWASKVNERIRNQELMISELMKLNMRSDNILKILKAARRKKTT